MDREPSFDIVHHPEVLRRLFYSYNILNVEVCGVGCVHVWVGDGVCVCVCVCACVDVGVDVEERDKLKPTS